MAHHSHDEPEVTSITSRYSEDQATLESSVDPWCHHCVRVSYCLHNASRCFEDIHLRFNDDCESSLHCWRVYAPQARSKGPHVGNRFTNGIRCMDARCIRLRRNEILRSQLPELWRLNLKSKS